MRQYIYISNINISYLTFFLEWSWSVGKMEDIFALRDVFHDQTDHNGLSAGAILPRMEDFIDRPILRQKSALPG